MMCNDHIQYIMDERIVLYVTLISAERAVGQDYVSYLENELM